MGPASPGASLPFVSLSEPIQEGTETRSSLLSVQARSLRAAAVAIVWILSCAPLALGAASCPMAETLGVPCPGCGMTRAVLLLGRGDVLGSLRMHPLAVPSALTSLLVMVATVWITAREGTPFAIVRRKIGQVAVAAFVAVQVAMIGVWIARMLGALGGPVSV